MRRLLSALLASAITLPVAAQFVMSNAYDAFGAERKGLTQGFGFASVVQHRGKWILFDAGTDARTFERNVKTLKIDLRKIDVAIVSHGHYDHIGGFDALLSVNPGVRIYAPGDFFSLGAPTKFPFREPDAEAAATLSKDELYFRGESAVEGMVTVPTGRFWKSNVEYVTVAKEVLPGVTVIPTTSKLMGTFIKYPPFSDEHPHFVGMPELSVSFATDKGEVVLAGCSHSGIETIVEETRRVRNAKIHLVAGGFHLIPYGREAIEALAKRMREEYGVESVAPAHCTGHTAFSVFRTVFGDGYRFWGLGETLKW